MSGGTIGKIAWIDLSSSRIEVAEPGKDIYEQYLGGYGLGLKLIWDAQKPGIKPLDPGNILGFAAGPLTGTPAPSASRYTIMGKSPLTGAWGDANSGGFFGTALKRAGFDGIFFKGASPSWVNLFIEDGKLEIQDASAYAGLDTNELEDRLKKEHGADIRVASIGQAGEKRSLLAGIINDKWRAAARSGLGALMGSKKLKAVIVRGSGKIPLAQQGPAQELRKTIVAAGQQSPTFQLFSGLGTCGVTAMFAANGESPVKNWKGVGAIDFPNAAAISDQSLLAYQQKKYACWGCPIACGGEMIVAAGPYACSTHKPEYETLGALGGMCLNDNLESIIKINDICDRAGIDTISLGATIAFAMECYEQGILSRKDADGLDLTWGNHQAMVALCEKIVRREGLGEIFADGTRAAAQKIGRGAEQYAMHVGGQEIPMHDPRCTPGYATSYCADATPARHMQGGSAFLESGFFIPGIPFEPVEKYRYSGKSDLHRFMSNLSHVINASGMCYFSFMVYGADMIPPFLEFATGRPYPMEELQTIGERIGAMRMLFNIREGVSLSDWKIPGRMIGSPPLASGPLAGVTVDARTLISEYLKKTGWDTVTGKPSAEKLKELSLKDMA